MYKVVLLCRVDGNFGGVERYLLTLAKGIDRTKYRPVIVGIGQRGELLRQAEADGFETEFLPMQNRFSILSAVQGLEEIARRRHAELIHTFGLRSNTLAWWMRNTLRLPWIVRLPNINRTDYTNPIRGGISHWANNFLIRRSDALQVISPQLEEYVRQWNHPPKSIFVIPNGVDTSQYVPQPMNQTFRKQCGIPEKAILLGSVGRLQPIKGYDVLIRIVSRICEEWPDAHLLLIGEGQERSRLRKLIQQYQIESRVHFAGFCEDVRPYLAALNIYICSSRSEGVPMAMLEAMAMGLPVVSTRVGGIESVIEEGVSGFLVMPDDEHALHEAIQELLMDRELLRTIGEEARQRVVNYFSYESMVERVQQMYENVMAIHSSRDQ